MNELTVTYDDQRVVLHPGQVAYVGRRDTSAVVVSDERVSREHVRLTWGPQGWLLENVGRTGTFIGGKQVTHYQLRRAVEARLAVPDGPVVHFEPAAIAATPPTMAAQSVPPGRTRASAGRPPKVFVNYRHGDTQGTAWALYSKLAERFGADNVLFDLGSARAGMRWIEEIRSSLGSPGVFIALIGPRWMEILTTHQQHGDDDYAVREIDLALRSPHLTVIPVLVDDAEFPNSVSLPRALRALTDLQVKQLRPANFLDDIEHLIARLAEVAANAAIPEAHVMPAPAPAAPAPAAAHEPPAVAAGRSAGAAEAAEPRAPSRPQRARDDAAGQNRQQADKAHGGNGRGKRPRSPADQHEDAVSRAVKEAVKPGLLTFNPPASMIQGRKERVEVGIARSPELREALTTGLRGRGEPQFEEISTSLYMGVELLGAAFEVTSFSPAEQLVAHLARWEFDVTPYRAGHQSLTLCISLRIDSPEITGGRIAVPVLEREIQVQVDIAFSARRFLVKNWQWLAATILGLGGALAAWITLFAK